MLDTVSLLRFFERPFLLRLLALLLFIALLPLADMYIAIELSGRFGAYLVIAAAAATGLFGFFLASVSSARLAGRIQRSIGAGTFPGRQFDLLAGTLLMAGLLILPGFLSDAFGLILFFPPFRRIAGRAFTRPLEGRLRQAFEYRKLERYF